MVKIVYREDGIEVDGVFTPLTKIVTKCNEVKGGITQEIIDELKEIVK